MSDPRTCRITADIVDCYTASTAVYVSLKGMMALFRTPTGK